MICSKLRRKKKKKQLFFTLFLLTCKTGLCLPFNVVWHADIQSVSVDPHSQHSNPPYGQGHPDPNLPMSVPGALPGMAFSGHWACVGKWAVEKLSEEAKQW